MMGLLEINPIVSGGAYGSDNSAATKVVGLEINYFLPNTYYVLHFGSQQNEERNN